MRQILRKSITWLFGIILSVLLVGVCGEWLIEVARAKGWYEDAGQQWDWTVSAVANFALSPPVLAAFSVLGGLVGGMWFDTLMRRREGPARPDGGLPVEAEAAHDPKVAVGSAATPTDQGFTLHSEAVVRDPSLQKQLERAIYVAGIIVSAERLRRENILEIQIRGFNGTPHPLMASRIEGSIETGLAIRKEVKTIELLTPFLVRDKSPLVIKGFGEFTINLAQHLAPNVSRYFQNRLGKETLLLSLRGLSVLIIPLDDRATHAKISLWDGVSLLPQKPDGFLCKQTHHLQPQSLIVGTQSLPSIEQEASG